MLGLIAVMVFVGLHDLAQFFISEKSNRKFWLKAWIIVSLFVFAIDINL